MKDILENGSNWPLEELDESARVKYVDEAFNFESHKDAKGNPKMLKKMIEKDVTHGYGLVLPLSKMGRIPGVHLAQMNIMKQNTIDKHRRIVEKGRLTHDQSYKFGSETSVSSRLNKDSLLQCRFGTCLKIITK